MVQNSKSQACISNTCCETAMNTGLDLTKQFENLSGTIHAETAFRMTLYAKNLVAIAKIDHYLRRRELAFRGLRECVNNKTDENKGNFIAFFKEIANGFPLLKSYIIANGRKVIQ